MTLKKSRFIEAIAEQTGFTPQKSSETLETLLELIKSTLESGEDVMITGFGKFCATERREGHGYNMKTREHMILAQGGL